MDVLPDATYTCELCLESTPDDAADWVRPCKCARVVHQTCLLSSIDDEFDPDVKGKCAVCGHRYTIDVDRPGLMLSLFRLTNATANLAAKFVILGGSVVLCLYTMDRITHLARLYGVYTLKSLFGTELFDTLLTADTSNWTLTERLFIPILSMRTLMSPSPFTLRHILSYVLCFPSEPPLAVRNQLVHNALQIGTPPSAALFATPFDTFAPRWPPTRLQFGACLYLAHMAYDLAVLRTVRLSALLPGNAGLVFDAWSLSVVARVLVRRWRAGRGEPPAAVPVEAVQQGEGEGGGEAAAPAPAPAPAPAAAPEEPADPPRDVVELNAAEALLHSQSAPVVQALFLPFIAAGMGELIGRAANHWAPIRTALGMKSAVGVIGLTLSADMLTDVNYWHRFTVWLWSSALDPVWIRNTLGLGLFQVGKDCLHTYHLYLQKQEIHTRTIKSRDFSGLDPDELDLVPRV